MYYQWVGAQSVKEQESSKAHQNNPNHQALVVPKNPSNGSTSGPQNVDKVGSVIWQHSKHLLACLAELARLAFRSGNIIQHFHLLLSLMISDNAYLIFSII